MHSLWIVLSFSRCVPLAIWVNYTLAASVTHLNIQSWVISVPYMSLIHDCCSQWHQSKLRFLVTHFIMFSTAFMQVMKFSRMWVCKLLPARSSCCHILENIWTVFGVVLATISFHHREGFYVFQRPHIYPKSLHASNPLVCCSWFSENVHALPVYHYISLTRKRCR